MDEPEAVKRRLHGDDDDAVVAGVQPAPTGLGAWSRSRGRQAALNGVGERRCRRQSSVACTAVIGRRSGAGKVVASHRIPHGQLHAAAAGRLGNAAICPGNAVVCVASARLVRFRRVVGKASGRSTCAATIAA